MQYNISSYARLYAILIDAIYTCLCRCVYIYIYPSVYIYIQTYYTYMEWILSKDKRIIFLI